MVTFAAILTIFASDLAGQASAIDGDTREIHGARMRLWGIDAPRVRSALPDQK
jgi:endonuclease YncB( thermonuclease family)